MSELQDTADHLVVIGRGRVVADASVSELLAEASSGRVTLRTSAPPRAAQVLHGAGATVLATGPDILGVTGLPDEEIVALLARNGVPFSQVSTHRATLEEAYMELTRDAVEYRGIPAREATR
jgi:ABC-2 type transport system ATP-binding protein